MEIPVNSWFDAITLRHSQRKYSGEIPDEKVIKRLEQVCNDFRPFFGTRAVLVREPADNVFKGIIGSYFKVTNAPYYIAFIANMNEPNIQEITGYMGEGIILEATALGLNTCWVGGFFRREAVMKQIELKENENVLAITPVGYSELDRDRVGNSSKQYRRKNLAKLVVNEELSKERWMKSALETTRVAPSAANRQPWRFTIHEKSITISADSTREGFGVSRRLDCGIAMLHIELGARKADVSGSWKFLKYPHIAEFRMD